MKYNNNNNARCRRPNLWRPHLRALSATATAAANHIAILIFCVVYIVQRYIIIMYYVPIREVGALDFHDFSSLSDSTVTILLWFKAINFTPK